MATKTITTVFTTSGAPATGITPAPTANVWKTSDGTQVVTGAAVTEVGGGFYKYDFTTFDPTEDYVFQFDAGASPSPAVDQRYQWGTIEETREQIADSVWDEAISGHVSAGSTGKQLDDLTPASIADASWDEAHSGHTTAGTFGEIMKLLRVVLGNKHQLTKVSDTQFNVVIYEDDGITPAKSLSITKAGSVETRV